MPWESYWPRVKRRRSLPVMPSTTIPNPDSKYISQPSKVQLLPPIEEQPSLRRPSSQIIRKPVPREGQVNTHISQNTDIAPARILFQTDYYIISSLPGKDPQDVLARIQREGIPSYNHNTQSCCQQHRRPHENANPRIFPVLSALDASADDDDFPEIEGHDLRLPPVRTTTPLGFGQFEFSYKDSSNTSMVPWIQTHPDTPIGGHKAAPMKVVDEKGRYDKRYATRKISFPSERRNNNNKKTRKEARSSSTYIPPNYAILLDGNNSRSQSAKADGNQYCCSLGQNLIAVPSSSGPESCYAPECESKLPLSYPDTPRESCHAQECAAKPTPSGASPSQIEKWVSEMDHRNYMATRISSIDGAQTPPDPLTSISDPPLTSLHHSQAPPTAPLPIPVETTSVNPVPRNSVTSKMTDTLRNKRGQESRQGLRKFRKLIFRKGILKVVLGRQLAQPTADLLDMMAKGIEFDPPDMKALAKPPIEVPGGGVPV